MTHVQETPAPEAPKEKTRWATHLSHPSYRLVAEKCPKCDFPEAAGGYCPECGWSAPIPGFAFDGKRWHSVAKTQ